MSERAHVPWICDHCGGVSVAEIGCPCQQSFDLVALHRRFADARSRARRTDAAVGRVSRVA